MIHMMQKEFLNFKESVLDNFYLFNSKEIINFINSNKGETIQCSAFSKTYFSFL